MSFDENKLPPPPLGSVRVRWYNGLTENDSYSLESIKPLKEDGSLDLDELSNKWNKPPCCIFFHPTPIRIANIASQVQVCQLFRGYVPVIDIETFVLFQLGAVDKPLPPRDRRLTTPPPSLSVPVGPVSPTMAISSAVNPKPTSIILPTGLAVRGQRSVKSNEGDY
ncbi:hypothetical protein PILCRDRAFT_824714 [Piloderma croceum F 1598]|uniref:Uncharacterized protein n=1 Tax=Piloderma croceum (strain F 1598) TaxID=765440 RepID=A0A0C3AW47_PILCF|nr:hypothetical protein PILCRDRAFT_824714 [Piloderma croceum F 1598]